MAKKTRKARTPQARENQMVSLAVDLAEKQLREGTASSQVITHYLKLASTEHVLNKKILEAKEQLMTAKTENMKSQKRVEELYSKALSAMREYSGQVVDEYEEE